MLASTTSRLIEKHGIAFGLTRSVHLVSCNTLGNLRKWRLIVSLSFASLAAVQMNHSPYQQSPAGDDKDAAAGSVGEASTVSLHVVAAKVGLRMLSTSSCLIGPTQDRCSPKAEADMML